jgi:pilus assembly protein CpaF
VTEILALGRRVENGIIESSMVFSMIDRQLQPQANSMPAAEKFARAGYDVAALLESR